MDEVLRTWDIGKLELKPGDILVFRLHRATYPSPGGPVPQTYQEVAPILKAGKDVVRTALDDMGLQDVHLLFLTEDWDLHAITPLDLIDMNVRSAEAKDKANERLT